MSKLLTAAMFVVLISCALVALPAKRTLAQTQTIITLASPTPSQGGGFGESVAMSGSTLVVGAPAAAGGEGRAYIYDATTGALIANLTSPNPQTYGSFGYSVAVTSTTVAVSAPYENSSGIYQAGHVYLFDAATGALTATLGSPNPRFEGYFGSDIAASGNTVVVSAASENASGVDEAGHAYIFDAATGSLMSTLSSPSPQADGYFGAFVATSGDTVVIDASNETTQGGLYPGRVYVYQASTTSLTLTATLKSPDPYSYAFGVADSLSGNVLLVGAYGENVSDIAAAGQAYLFDIATGALTATLTSPDPQQSGWFGIAVADGSGIAIVGAPNEAADGMMEAGSAYLFNATSGDLIANLTSPSPQQDGFFSASMALSGSTLAIGAPGEKVGSDTYAGHVYIINLGSISSAGTASPTTTSSRSISTTSVVTSLASSETKVSTTSNSSNISAQMTTSTRTTPGGAGGIPEFPYQPLAVSLLTSALVASYAVLRRKPVRSVVGALG